MGTGFARCLNAGCEEYDADREIPIVRTEMVQRAPDLPIVITTTAHFHLENDADLKCPSCGGDCAVLPDARRSIPRYV